MSETRLVPIQFGTRLSQHQSGILSNELAQNVYLEKAPEGAKAPYTLIGTPGLKSFLQPQADGPVRGLIEFKDHLFAVVGNMLYKITESGSKVALGVINGVGNVSMAHNGSWLWVLVPSGPLYAVDENTIDVELSAEIDGQLSAVASQDGYLMVCENRTNRWHLSGLDSAGNTITGLFTTADTLPGTAVGIISDHREVLVLKTDSIEAYQNSGSAAFPFQQTQVVERGCVAPLSVAKDRNMVFWLGDDLLVYAMSGYQPKPISTDEIADIIGKRTSPQTAVGWTYQQGGHTFYVLSFSDYTMVYDIDTGLWHRRKSHLSDRWRVNTHVYVRKWNKHIVGDISTGDLYELDLDTYTENGTLIPREIISAPIWANGNRFIIDELLFDIEAGVGIQRGREAAWAASTTYAVGDKISNGGKVYECIQGGITYVAGRGPIINGVLVQDGPFGEGQAIEEASGGDPLTPGSGDIIDLEIALGLLASVGIPQHAANAGGAYHGATNTYTSLTATFGDFFGAFDGALTRHVSNYEDHRTDVSVDAHTVDDDTNTASTADASSAWRKLVDKYNTLYANYSVHRADTTYHSVADTTNIATVGGGFNVPIVWTPIIWKFLYNEDDGEDPKALLDWSCDGGKTWLHCLSRSFGKIGEYKRRCRFHRLGAYRNWTGRIRITDPVPIRINGVYIRMDELGT